MNLEAYQLLTIFVVGLVAILGASEIGRLLGVRATGRGGDDVSTLEGAILGLLALMMRSQSACFDLYHELALHRVGKFARSPLRSC